MASALLCNAKYYKIRYDYNTYVTVVLCNEPKIKLLELQLLY